MPVRKRGDSWQVDVRIDRERIRETYRTKKDAVAREKQLIAHEVTGTFVRSPTEQTTFRRFAAIYLDYARANKAEQTVHNETWILGSKMMPTFGKMPLTSIRPRHVEQYKAARLAEGVENRTVNIELQLLSVLFKLAIRWNYATENPLAHVDKLREPEKPKRFLSNDEVRRLLAAAQPSYLYPLVMCGLHTGMRPKELYNLRWTDVDIGRSTITVRATKTNSYHAVEMTPFLQQVLRDHLEVRESEYVFAYRGKPIRSAKKAFARICERGGIEDCTLYTLRHTFASHLAMRGVPLVQIQHLMGHSSYETTLVYAHLSTESQRGHVNRLPFANHPEEDE
jgi:integrase